MKHKLSMRFKQPKIRNGPETTQIKHPHFSTLPKTRLTWVYQNFLLWNMYNCHGVPTRRSESVPTTENTQFK